MNTHLKPEQFDDLLMGIAGNEAKAHLDECAQCRAEIEALRQALGSFRAAAVSWSEGMAKQVAAPRKRWVLPLWTRPAWALAATALILAAAISFSLWGGHANKTTVNPNADAQAQITRDNQLLAHIDSEVGEITPTPMQPLQLSPKVRAQ